MMSATTLTSVIDSELLARPNQQQRLHHHHDNNNVINSPDNNNNADAATLREQLGQCPRCGQQLFKLPKSSSAISSSWKTKLGLTGSSTTNKTTMPALRKEPLTIDGKVQRGQCLVCTSSGTGNESAAASGENHNQGLVDNDEQKGLLEHDAFYTANGNINLVNVNMSGSNIHYNNVTYTGNYDAQNRFHDDNATLVYNDTGHVYQGAFCHGHRHGQGTLTFSSGGEYVGSFDNNFMHGSATRRYPNGDVYVGDFYRNQRHSPQSHLYFANGDLYIGSFVNDCLQTSADTTARYYYASGQRFQGTFYRNQRHGRGKLQKADGTLDVFVYCHDARQGPVGLRWNKERTKVWTVSAESGRVKKKISVAEAVSLEYELQQEAERLWSQVEHQASANASGSVLPPLFGPAESVAGSSVHGMMA